VCGEVRFVCECVFACVPYLHKNKHKFVAGFFRKIIFNTLHLSVERRRLVPFHPLHYQLVTIILDKILTCNKLQVL